MIDLIITHPDNRPFLDEVRQASPGLFDHPLYGVRVQYCEFMPPTADRWEPPAAGRFTTYGPEDEAWMRPLGLGRMVPGQPLFHFVDQKLLPLETWPLLRPDHKPWPPHLASLYAPQPDIKHTTC